jgi:hypothetical protein
MAAIRKACVPIEELRRLVAYNPQTGALTWLPREPKHFRAGREDKEGRHSPAHRAKVWNSHYAGTPALAAIERAGYGHGDIFAKRYKAHRVAWALYYGEWPEGEIDHINGIRSDNRLINLRVVSHKDNMRNQRLSKANKSGVIGVCWASHRGKWSAQIKVNRKKLHLGLFGTIKEAAAARKAAERKYGFHPNHGRVAA